MPGPSLMGTVESTGKASPGNMKVDISSVLG